MRELKFRAWSKETRALYSSDDIREFPLEVVKNGDVWTFEQYTGLKDKNGKEIYEGDIVKADGRIYEVAWFEKDGGWFCFRENDSVYTPLYHLKSEVIGNVHENKELLEGGK